MCELVQKQNGVTAVDLNYASKILRVEVAAGIDLDIVDKEIQDRVRKIGFGVRRQMSGWIQSFHRSLEQEANERLPWWLVSVVWFLTMWSSMIAFAAYGGGLESSEAYMMAIASSVFGLPAILMGIFPYAVSGLRALRYSRLITIDLFIFFGGCSATIVSVMYLLSARSLTYADSGSMVVALLLLAKKAENVIVGKVTSSILFQLNPTDDRVFVLRKGEWIFAKAHQIRKNDHVRVLTGETIPFDGVLESAQGEVNNHLLSGEGEPVSLVRGDHLFSGAIAASDLEMTVVSPQGERMIDAWAEQALIGQSRRPSYSRVFIFLEKYLVISAFLGAFILALLAWRNGLDRFAVAEAFFVGVLVFCPCLFASVLPLTKQMAHLALLRVGVMVSRSEALLELHRVTHIYLDKTGTLEAVESRFEPFKKVPMLEHYLSDLARRSTHPILRGLKLFEPTDTLMVVEETSGKGVVAITGRGDKLIVGRPKFLTALGVVLPRKIGVLFPVVAFNGEVVGQIVTKKTYDSRSREFIRKLLKMRPSAFIHVLSGDPNPEGGKMLTEISPRVVYEGNLSPEEKARRIRGKSAFVGDGLNDSLALAKADVSFLMGHRILGFAPVDFQIQFPNINLILATAQYARRYRSVLLQTIGAAFIYNVVAIGLAMAGKFSPLGAVLAMLFSFTCLTLSSLRLLHSPEVPK